VPRPRACRSRRGRSPEATAFHDALSPLERLRGAYRLRAMLGCALKLLCAVLLVVALFGASMGQAAPAFATTGPDMTMAAAPSAACAVDAFKVAPCKNSLQGCFTDVGCVWMTSLPTPSGTTVAEPPWSTVSYWTISTPRAGRAIEPSLFPPIRAA
jgi:hypothetical protein